MLQSSTQAVPLSLQLEHFRACSKMASVQMSVSLDIISSKAKKKTTASFGILLDIIRIY